MLLPMLVGGGPTEEAKTYRVLRSAEGKGGSAPDDSGIDGLWRWARARGLAAATSETRRAIANAFPFAAADLLPYYERALGLHPGQNESDTERRVGVVAGWTAKASALLRDLEAGLSAIDSRMSILNMAAATEHISHLGRWFGRFESAPELPAFGGDGCSAFAAWTTRYVLRVFFDVYGEETTYAKLSAADARARSSADEFLRASLPSYWDFTISTIRGFVTNSTPLGQTGVTDG